MGRAAALRRVVPAWAPLALAAALAPCAHAYAQAPAGSLTGLVLSGADSTPVVGAFVEIAGTTLHTATDAAGRFAFTRTPPGILVLRVARIGFLPATVRLRGDSAATPEITVVLVPAPIEVSPLVVTASRETHLAEDAPTSVSVATSQDIEHRATIGVDAGRRVFRVRRFEAHRVDDHFFHLAGTGKVRSKQQECTLGLVRVHS